MRLADTLTVVRAVAAVPVAALILTGHERPAATLVALAGISDVLDGWLARRTLQTSFGHHFDPIADKLLTDAALLALATRGRLPWALVLLLTLRDLLVTALRVTDGTLTPSPAARLKTGALYASITLLLRGGDRLTHTGRAGVTGAAALSLLSAWSYLRRR